MHVQNLMNSVWDIRIFLGLVPNLYLAANGYGNVDVICRHKKERNVFSSVVLQYEYQDQEARLCCTPVEYPYYTCGLTPLAVLVDGLCGDCGLIHTCACHDHRPRHMHSTHHFVFIFFFYELLINSFVSLWLLCLTFPLKCSYTNAILIYHK